MEEAFKKALAILREASEKEAQQKDGKKSTFVFSYETEKDNEACVEVICVGTGQSLTELFFSMCMGNPEMISMVDVAVHAAIDEHFKMQKQDVVHGINIRHIKPTAQA